MQSDVQAIRRAFAAVALLILALTGLPARAQQHYQKPPKAILDVLNAPATPQVAIRSSTCCGK